MTERPELLSPAGDFTTALAAFEAGADAVYCGLADFSARAFAVNFSAEDLKNLVRVAHAKNRKVYVTFNTLVDESDLEAAVGRLAELAEIGPDALIVQDLGIARLVRRHFPSLALHASTQLVAHNLEGVLALRDLGFSRVVLARELSLDEITFIAKRCGGLELECFIHGALCYSISGLCLFSALEKGRSGNRGACAYCCRLGYEEPNGHKTLPFSMKDLRLGEDIRKLVQAGVVSLKIEGRMKSALYVASVTRYYRQILDGGEGAKVTVSDLETVFSRRTTELYFHGQSRASSSPVDPTSLGHLGTPIGTVKRVTKDREGRSWVRFHTARALERHDGLQFVIPGEESGAKPFGFGISEMRTALSRSTVFEVSAGTDVEVLLPDGDAVSSPSRGDAVSSPSRGDAVSSPRLGNAMSSPRLQGSTVYCSMSNAVKRMFPAPSFRPSDYPGDIAIDIRVTLEKSRIVAEAHLSAAFGDSAVRVSADGTFAPAKDPSRTFAAVEKAFSKLGGTDYRLGVLKLDDPERLFAPASMLNDLRRDLVERLDAARATARAAAIERALADETLASPHSCASSPRRQLRLRAGHPIPPGAWDEIVIAITPSTSTSSFDFSPPSTSTSSFDFTPPSTSTFSFDFSPRLALPVFTKDEDFNRLRSLVKRLVREGYTKWEASDLATVRLLRQVGVTDITADWTLYAFNSSALAALAELGVTRFVASPENGADNLAYLTESGYDVARLVQQSTPLFISLTKPATCACGDLRIFERDGLWITTKRMPRTWSVPEGVATRVDLSWDPPTEGEPA